MLDSPRSPSRTMRIFSSAEYCLRVARRMFFTSRSDGELARPDFCLISVLRLATMSQKSSLPQLAKSISPVLTPDKIDCRLSKRSDAVPHFRIGEAKLVPAQIDF